MVKAESFGFIFIVVYFFCFRWDQKYWDLLNLINLRIVWLSINLAVKLFKCYGWWSVFISVASPPWPLWGKHFEMASLWSREFYAFNFPGYWLQIQIFFNLKYSKSKKLFYKFTSSCNMMKRTFSELHHVQDNDFHGTLSSCSTPQY